MGSRIHIFDHFQKPIAEISVTTTPRSWVLNGHGRCDFSMSTSDPKCTERILQFGNLIHIEHVPTKDENGNFNGTLPTWTGVILTPRTWNYGIVNCTAYSAEAILSFRAMPYVTVKGTPKHIFSQILEHAHTKAKNIIIQENIMDDIQATFSDDLRTNAYDHIGKLIKDTGMDWSITGDINEKGNLELFANLYYRKGINTPLILNNNNTELQSPLLIEQGTPSNQVFGYSQANTSRSRFSVEITDQESIDDYGPLQLNQVYVGRHDKAGIENSTKARVDKRARPVRNFRRVALDRKSIFDYLNVGNTVTVKEISAGFHPEGGLGFESTVKIIGMEYNDLSNKAPLNLEIENAS
jgi:hypothetical protein